MDPLSAFLIKTFEQNHPSIFTSSSSVVKSFPWNDVISFISEYKAVLSEKLTLKNFTAYIIQLLLDFDCSDLQFVRRLMELYYVSRDELFIAYSWNIFMISYEARVPTALENFLKWSQTPENTEWENCDYNSINHTVKGLKFGDFNFMKLLCKYGFTSLSKASFHPQNYFDPSPAKTLFKFLCYSRFLNPDELHPELLNEEFRTPDFLDSWNRVNWPQCGISKPNLNRVILIVKGIDTLLQILQGKPFECVQCFRQYFETITDPFLIIPEIKGFLICLAKFYSVENFMVKVDRMVTAFQVIYPESELTFNPTTLQHMCRCNVREMIGKQKQSPLFINVKKLKIPRPIKKYILCE